MGSIYKPSRAKIIRPAATRKIRLIQYANPEQILPPLMQEFFIELGYSSMYPNFKHLRVGAVHPFALLLFQDSLGQKLDLSIFPSITISDSSDTEVYSELGRGFENYQLTAEMLAYIVGSINAGKIIISDANLTRLQTAVADGSTINCSKVNYHSNHNIDINIWSENKDLTSLLYDMVKHFIMGNINRLRLEGIDIQNPIGGRRSGDINVEFGRLLYGANVTVSAVIDTANMWVDIPIGEIVTINPDPDYSVTS